MFDSGPKSVCKKHNKRKWSDTKKSDVTPMIQLESQIVQLQRFHRSIFLKQMQSQLEDSLICIFLVCIQVIYVAKWSIKILTSTISQINSFCLFIPNKQLCFGKLCGLRCYGCGQAIKITPDIKSFKCRLSQCCRKYRVFTTNT